MPKLKPYSMYNKYNVSDVIQHQKFGAGTVISTSSGDITVLFVVVPIGHNNEKILVHNRSSQNLQVINE